MSAPRALMIGRVGAMRLSGEIVPLAAFARALVLWEQPALRRVRDAP